MFNKFILDESSIFILLIQFHLHLISFHQRFPHHLHDIFFQNFQKKHLASARCSVKKFQFLPAYIFNATNIISRISKYYFRLLQYGITRVDLALYLFYNIHQIPRAPIPKVNANKYAAPSRKTNIEATEVIIANLTSPAALMEEGSTKVSGQIPIAPSV